MTTSKALVAKEKGNAAFKAGDFATAIGNYTEAIFADRTDPTFPLNRAAAYLKLGKYEDAERDCSTVLGLAPLNAKALFRRGQARMGMNKLIEAQRDFNETLRLEPNNPSVKEELKKVAELIEREKAKKTKSSVPATVLSSVDREMAPKRRRIPIKILDTSGSIETVENVKFGDSSTNPVSKNSREVSQPATTPSVSIENLQPVSSRSLKSPATKSQPSQPKSVNHPDAVKPLATPLPPSSLKSLSGNLQPPHSKAPTPPDIQVPPTTSSDLPPPKATSFKDAKKSRDDAKPSRVGGGIFRTSGNHTIFPTRSIERTPLSGSGVASPPKTPSNELPIKAPTTLFDLVKAWSLTKSEEEKWDLISTIPPANIPSVCKNSLEPAMLVSIMDTFLFKLNSSTNDDKAAAAIKEYMESFGNVPRFGTLLLLLSEKEKDVARGIWKKLDTRIPDGYWNSIVPKS